MKEKNMETLRREYEAASMSAEQLEKMKQEILRGKMDNRREKKINGIMKSVAAVLAVFVILPNTSANVAHAMGSIPVIGKLVEVVTFREYHYEDEHHVADVEVQAPVVIEAQKELEESQRAEPVSIETLKKTTEEISAEIEQITEQIIAEFEKTVKEELGYHEIMVDSEVIPAPEDYFTLKLSCFEAAGSGAEWNYFYTIDMRSGERLALKDLFVEGTDYITPISEDIKKQMRQQMETDESMMYWLDDQEMPDWNFKAITEDASFYINKDNKLVIAFNEGDVAPMYMGCVEFVIDEIVLKDIRK